MALTKAVNVFDITQREIRCIAKEHDYLGDGRIIVEEELEVGMIYTFAYGKAAAYGNMVFLRELPKSFGYQSYLFEELVPYDADEFMHKSRQHLLKIEEREILEDVHKRRTPERRRELSRKLRETVYDEKFDPDYRDGHDYGDAYWIYPVLIPDDRRVGFLDTQVIKEQEISIPGKYFNPLLTDFFTDGINPDLPINARRMSTDEVPGGTPIYGFEWFLHPNYYTYSDMHKILSRMKQAAGWLRTGTTEPATIRQQSRLREAFAIAAERTPGVTYEDAMRTTAEFYEKLTVRIQQMMDVSPQADAICVMAP